MACKLEACAECTQKCLLVHGKKINSSPVITSFFKVMIGNQFSEVLYLPPKFAPTVFALIGQETLLKDSNGRQWMVTVSNLSGSLAFQRGWNAFSSDHRLEIGDFLVFNYIMGSYFVVHIYNKTGCEKIDFALIRNQRKRARSSRISTFRDVQCYRTHKDSMKKQCSSNSRISESDEEISQNQCEMNDVEKAIAQITSNCKVSCERPQSVSKEECLDDPYYLIDRNQGDKQGEDRCPLFNLSHFEMSDNNGWMDKSNKINVGDEYPQHNDAPSKSQIQDVSGNKYPVVEDVVDRVVPSDASNFEIIKNNSVEEIEKIVTVSNNSNDEFSKHLRLATAIEPEKIVSNSFNSLNGVFKRCHIVEEKSKSQCKSPPETDQVMLSQMDCTSLADINQSVPLKIIAKSREFSVPVITGMQKSQWGKRMKIVKQEPVEMTPELFTDEKIQGESMNIVKQEPVEMTPELFSDEEIRGVYGKLPQLLKMDSGQIPYMITRENAITREVKTEIRDLVPTSSPSAPNISFVVASDNQPFLELPTCSPNSCFNGRFSRERKVVSKVLYLQDPDTRMWPVLCLEGSGFKILTSGWEAFSKANNIQSGDECVFGIGSDSQSIYGVNIVRKYAAS